MLNQLKTHQSSKTFGHLAFVISLCLYLFSNQLFALEMPTECVQLPSRTQVCSNLLYKRAPLDVPQLKIKQGEAMCICLTDFASLRIAASDEQGKIDQIVSAGRAAAKLNISETDLLTLLRK